MGGCGLYILQCFSKHGKEFPISVWEMLDGLIDTGSPRSLRSELSQVNLCGA
jgi:hypothetical protein